MRKTIWKQPDLITARKDMSVFTKINHSRAKGNQAQFDLLQYPQQLTLTLLPSTSEVKAISESDRQMFPNLMRLDIVSVDLEPPTVSQLRDLVWSCQNLTNFKLRMLSYDTGRKLKIVNDFVEHLFDKCSQIDTLQLSSTLGIRANNSSRIAVDFRK